MGRKKREYTYDDWRRALDLHNIYKLGPTKISRILGINESTVKKWLYYDVIPPEAKWVAKPCIELGYAKGAIDGDACVYENKSEYEYIIQLNTIDPEFAVTFSRAMSRLLGMKYHKPWWDEKQKHWEITYKSKAFLAWYKRTKEQGLEGFKPYIEYNKETVRYYLRGLYDSDGNNNRNKQIHLYNSKKKLLEYVQYLLKEYFDIKATGPYLQRKAGITIVINGVESCYKHDCYEISISKKEHVQKFLNEIGFSIVRKQLGLKKHEKVFVEGRHVEPYRLVELGLFRLPFSDN